MSAKPPVKKILRIGLFQSGKFIEERLIHGRKSVSIGQDFKKNTFVVPVSKLPKTFPVFDMQNGQYVLNFTQDMSGKVSLGDGGGSPTLGDLVRGNKAKKGSHGYTVPLSDKTFGRIAFGTGADEVALLFQFVKPPPPRPKPVLPATMRGGVVTGVMGSLILAMTTAISAVLQVGFVAFVMSRDWPKPRDMEYQMSDRFVKLMIEEDKEEPEPEEVEVVEDGEGPGEEVSDEPSEEPAPKEEEKPDKKEMTPEERAAAEAERKRRLAEEVKNKTILSQLGALSADGGTLADTLSEGAGKTSMDEAFADSQGIQANVAGAEKSGLRTSGTSDADGKGSAVGIGDLGGMKGAKKAKAGVGTGSKKEKKIKVRVKLGGATKTAGGKLDANSISNAIKRRQRAIQSCYEREIKKNPKASGKVIVTFTIGNAGRVSASKPSKDSVGGGVGACVANTIKRIKFPRPKGGEVIVNKTFVFEVAQ